MSNTVNRGMGSIRRWQGQGEVAAGLVARSGEGDLLEGGPDRVLALEVGQDLIARLEFRQAGHPEGLLPVARFRPTVLYLNSSPK